MSNKREARTDSWVPAVLKASQPAFWTITGHKGKDIIADKFT